MKFATEATNADMLPPDMILPPAAKFKERRSWPRTKVNLFGLISFGKFTAQRCIVVDCHFEGARLKIPGDIEVPDAFEVYVPVLDLQRRGYVRWRGGDEVGVQFGR